MELEDFDGNHWISNIFYRFAWLCLTLLKRRQIWGLHFGELRWTSVNFGGVIWSQKNKETVFVLMHFHSAIGTNFGELRWTSVNFGELRWTSVNFGQLWHQTPSKCSTTQDLFFDFSVSFTSTKIIEIQIFICLRKHWFLIKTYRNRWISWNNS